MNASQIKVKIFLIRLFDWILVITIIGVGIPATIVAEDRHLYAIALLFGLGLINVLGNYSLKRVAQLRHTLERMQKKSQ